MCSKSKPGAGFASCSRLLSAVCGFSHFRYIKAGFADRRTVVSCEWSLRAWQEGAF